MYSNNICCDKCGTIFCVCTRDWNGHPGSVMCPKCGMAIEADSSCTYVDGDMAAYGSNDGKVVVTCLFNYKDSPTGKTYMSKLLEWSDIYNAYEDVEYLESVTYASSANAIARSIADKYIEGSTAKFMCTDIRRVIEECDDKEWFEDCD